MKIAFVVHNLSRIRGHDRYTFEIAKHFAERHEVHIFTCLTSGVDVSDMVIHKIPAIRFPILLKILSFIVMSCPIIWLVHKKERFDIIHYQGACAVPISPAVITAHLCSAAHLKIYKESAKNEILLKRIYHLIYAHMNVFFEKVFFKKDVVLKVISPSEGARKQLIEYYRLPVGKIERIYEGVNPEEFKSNKSKEAETALRQKLSIASSDFAVLFVGDYLVKGLHVAIKTIKDLKCKLIVLGRGNTSYYTDLALKEGVPDKVIFLEWQPDIYRYFAIADALLVPSLCDPFGLIVLEALASGTPCIVSKLAGASELLENGKNAILLDYPFSYTQIVEKLKHLISDTNFREKIIEEGKAIALQHPWKKVARETEALYESLHTCKR